MNETTQRERFCENCDNLGGHVVTVEYHFYSKDFPHQIAFKLKVHNQKYVPIYCIIRLFKIGN